MNELKKMWKIQKNFYIVATIFISVIAILFLMFYESVAPSVVSEELSLTANWAIGLQKDGFRQMHHLLFYLLLAAMLIKNLFMAGKENLEFIMTLPVTSKGKYIFNVVSWSGMIIVVYCITYFAYSYRASLAKPDEQNGLEGVAVLFLFGLLCSLFELMVMLLLKMIIQMMIRSKIAAIFQAGILYGIIMYILKKVKHPSGAVFLMELGVSAVIIVIVFIALLFGISILLCDKESFGRGENDI